MTVIRKAQSGDAEAVARVHVLSRSEAMPWLAKVHTEAETVWWIENVVLPNQEVWVAEDDAGVIAIAALDGSTLEQLYVLPGFQGMGVGSELLHLAVDRAEDPLDLWTFARNAAARAFYTHHGFIEVESTDGSSNEEHEPDVHYQYTK